MNTHKLEPRLLNLIEEQKVRATYRGMTAADVEAEAFDVTISHHEYLQPAEGRDRATSLQELEQKAKQSQNPILSKLQQLKADKGVIIHSLTNAVTTKLSPKQMMAVAELDEVKIIRLEATDAVTCMNESIRVIDKPVDYSFLPIYCLDR